MYVCVSVSMSICIPEKSDRNFSEENLRSDDSFGFKSYKGRKHGSLRSVTLMALQFSHTVGPGKLILLYQKVLSTGKMRKDDYSVFRECCETSILAMCLLRWHALC